MGEFASIFVDLRAMLAAYAPPFVVTVDKPDRYQLWSRKPVEIAGRKCKGVFFGSVVMRKGYVGLYYMPVYAEPKMQAIIPPVLLRLLRGKSCFHVREMTPELSGAIADALERGLVRYREGGWV